MAKVMITVHEHAKSFLRISSSKVDRFTSNQYRNDLRSILHIIKYIHQRKCIIFRYLFFKIVFAYSSKRSATFPSILAYRQYFAYLVRLPTSQAVHEVYYSGRIQERLLQLCLVLRVKIEALLREPPVWGKVRWSQGDGDGPRGVRW